MRDHIIETQECNHVLSSITIQCKECLDHMVNMSSNQYVNRPIVENTFQMDN